MNTRMIFLDGKMVRAEAALVDSLAPGAVDGKGAFETMRVRDGKVRDLKEHLGRLSKGLDLLRLGATHPPQRLESYLYRTLKANGLRESRVRLAVWREKRRRRISIVCQPFAGYSEDQYRKGFHAVVSDVQRAKTRFSHIKSMDYVCFRRALTEARKKGYDEAVLLNNRKEIVEGSRTNIFFARRGVLYTPAVRCGALNGITRRQVIRCARREKVPVKVVAAGVRELFRADEVFVTNSLMGIMPVTAVEGRPVGSGRVGPVTQKLFLRIVQMLILLARHGANLYNKTAMNTKWKILLFALISLLLIKTDGSAEDPSAGGNIFDDIKTQLLSSTAENRQLVNENKALKAELINLQLEIEQYEQEIEQIDPGYKNEREAAKEQKRRFAGRGDPRDDDLIQEAQNLYLSGRMMALDDVQRLRELQLYDLQYQKQELELDLKSMEFLNQKVDEQRRPELDALEREIEENVARTRNISAKIAEEEKAAMAYPQDIDLLKMENEALKQKIRQLKQWMK